VVLRTRNSIVDALNLREVVNARGPMTLSGAASMPEEVVQAMAAVSSRYVLVDELATKVARAIAAATGAEAALVTSGAAAGIVLATAACMTRSHPALASRLPDTAGLPDEVVVQAGHLVTYVRQVRITGARIITAGSVYPVTRADLEAAITPRTAAILHVVSHHCHPKGFVALEDVVAIGRARGVPVVVDAAAELDLRAHVATGADLVIYSGGKAIPGPSGSGFVCGRADLIAAAKPHVDGLARAMKVGKEVMVGLLAALYVHQSRDHEKLAREWTARCDRLVDVLHGVPGVDIRIQRDWRLQLTPGGHPLPRVEIVFEGTTSASRAHIVARRLRDGDPVILLRDYWADSGRLHLDVTCLDDTGVQLVGERVHRALMESGGKEEP
jgi:L-seryl-tRNA(Ser) seleniumtransferase/D-glucosaminate-6-phosphate ammonia-lyase